MRNFIHILLGLALIAFSGCLDDKSTMADHEIDDLQVTGLKKHYSIKALGELSITPVVYSDDPNDDFRFEWYLFNEEQDTKLTPEKMESYLISEDPVLRYQVKVKTGNYRLLVKAYSKKSGLMAEAQATVGVAETNGFFILKETEDGNTDIDLFSISNENVKGKLYPNRLQALQGASLAGKPRHLDIIYNQAFYDPDSLAVGIESATLDHTFCVTTDKNEVCFARNADFVNIMPKNKMFMDEEFPSPFTPYRGVESANSVALITREGIYTTPLGDGRYDLPGTFQDAFEGGAPGSERFIMDGNFVFIYWDNVANSLRCLDIDFNATDKPFESKVKGFSTENLNYDPLFLGCTDENDLIVALLREKDKSATYLYFLGEALLDFNATLDSVAVFKGQDLLNQATEYAINAGGSINSAPYLYFVANNKLYTHSLVSKVADEETRLEGIGAGENITYLSNYYWIDKEVPSKSFDYLIVGTQTGNTYKMYFYNLIGGKPHGSPVYTVVGNGKVKQIQYVSSVYKVNNNFFPILDH